MKLAPEFQEVADLEIKTRCDTIRKNYLSYLRELRQTGKSRHERCTNLPCIYEEYLQVVANNVETAYGDVYGQAGIPTNEEDLIEIGEVLDSRLREDFGQHRLISANELDVLPLEATIKSIIERTLEKIKLGSKRRVLLRKVEEERIMAQNLVTENQRKHYQVLKRIYVESEGVIGERVSWDTIATKEGLTHTEVANVCRYLDEERLTEPNGFRAVSITNIGKNEIEKAESNPSGATEHFTTAVIQHFHAAVYGVQTAGQHNTQTVLVNINPDFDKNVSNLIELIRTSTLPDLQKEDAIEALERLPRLAQKEKTPDVTEAAKKRLDLVKTTIDIGTTLAPMAVPYLQYLYRWFQS